MFLPFKRRADFSAVAPEGVLDVQPAERLIILPVGFIAGFAAREADRTSTGS
jgi:hypothetical protein